MDHYDPISSNAEESENSYILIRYFLPSFLGGSTTEERDNDYRRNKCKKYISVVLLIKWRLNIIKE